MEDDDYIVLI